MMDSFSAPGRSVSRLNVSLRSTNSASEQNILIENAHVRWEIRLSGLGYILYEWRLTSFLIVMCCCVAIQGSAFGVVVAVLSAIVREREMELEDEIDESEYSPPFAQVVESSSSSSSEDEEEESKVVEDLWSSIATPPTGDAERKGTAELRRRCRNVFTSTCGGDREWCFWCSSVVFECGFRVRKWCSSVVFERGVRALSCLKYYEQICITHSYHYRIMPTLLSNIVICTHSNVTLEHRYKS